MEIEPSPAHLTLLAQSAMRLTASLSGLTDVDVAAPVALPGWTRAHVLSHLTAQVPALERLLRWAGTGVETLQYASRTARDAEIAAGVERPAEQLVAEVGRAAEHLQGSFAELAPAAWSAPIRPFTGEWCTAKRLLVIRLRELEVHHVDLQLGYSFDDIPVAAADILLADVTGYLAEMATTTPPCELRLDDGRLVRGYGVAGPTVSGARGALLAWLTGRSSGAGLASTGAVPQLPAWI